MVGCSVLFNTAEMGTNIQETLQINFANVWAREIILFNFFYHLHV